MPYLYILECEDKSFYTGSAVNLERELLNHQNGVASKYTKTRLPVALVYLQEFDDINDAFRYEKILKGWGHDKKRALIEGKIILSNPSRLKKGDVNKFPS